MGIIISQVVGINGKNGEERRMEIPILDSK
jgi:hypothetical protein